MNCSYIYKKTALGFKKTVSSDLSSVSARVIFGTGEDVRLFFARILIGVGISCCFVI